MSITEKKHRLSELTAELDIPESAASLTPAQQRLKAARERAAALDDAVVDNGDPRVAAAGEWMHSVDESGVKIMRSTSIFGAASVTLMRGDEILVDEEMLAADLDRHGRPGWSGVLHDEAAQLQRWGAVRLRPGRAPRDLESWTYGSALWAEAREQARREAHRLPTEQQRADALAEVHRRFGAAPTTSVTLNTAKTASERAAVEQEARIRSAAAKGAPNVGPSRAGA
ncbi:hypothetical protein ACFV3I_18255 [Microbacterium sp. NPDC059771]|uniref:hypothetical protein n=1 Tax=Microbacterium sp. NPDC059771 TaxID=3346941 RepID=UPI00364878C5